MKFINLINNYKLLVVLLIMSMSLTLKLRLSQTGVEQHDITMNIYNNSTEFISSGIINIKLIQVSQQPVNGTNKYLGYWQVIMKSSQSNITPFEFMEQLPNFGRLVDKQTVNVDYRYIQGCSFDTKEEANTIKTIFQLISKESTTQHVYGIEFILPSANIKIDDVKKYYTNVATICQSTAETSNLLKGQLAQILKDNLALKKKKPKISGSGQNKNTTSPSTSPTTPTTPTTSPSSNNNTLALPGSPGKVRDDINLEDIEDPNVKNQIKKLQDEINSEKDNIAKNSNAKDKLVKRANELFDRLDKDNQQLSVMLPKNEENQQNALGANKTINEAQNNITNLTKTNLDLNNTLTDVKTNKTAQDQKVKLLTDNYNNLKAELNKNIEDQKNLKKAIAEIEAQANVQTETLASIEEKKKNLLSKINDLVSEIKKDGDDIESNGKNLQLVQTNFNNLEEESKKIEKNIEELKKKLADLMKKENDIKKQIDPKHISTLETQKQTTITQLSQLEKSLQLKKDDLMSIIDPQWGEIFDKAYAEITNRDNHDPQAYLKVLKLLPPFIWQVPSS